MTKQNGLGLQAFVSGKDLGDDIQQFSTGSPIATHDLTPITKSAMVRRYGLRDGALNFTAFFNPADGSGAPADPAGAHDHFSDLPTGDQLSTILVGQSLAFPALSMMSKQIGYDGSRAADGMLTFAVNEMANGYGLEWCQQLTAGKRTDTSATNGTAADLGSASPGAFGLQAYLHVFAFTGTSVAIKLQESSDNGAGDAFADVVGGAFASVTAGPGFQRIATGAINVERYLRVVTTGTFSNLVFAVVANRNPVAVQF